MLGINESQLGEGFLIILFLFTFSKLYEKTMKNLGVEMPYKFATQSTLRL